MGTFAANSEQVAARRSGLTQSGRRGVRARDLFEITATAAEEVADVLTVVFAIATSNWVYLSLHLGRNVRYSELSRTAGSIVFAAGLVLFFAIDGGYQRGNSLLRIRETERILRASARSFSFVFAASFFTAELFSRAILLVSLVLVPLFLVLEKQLLHLGLQWLRSTGRDVRRVVIYGAGSSGRRLFSALARSPKLGLTPVGMIDDDPAVVGTCVFEYGYKRTRSVEVVQGPPTEALLERFGTDILIVAIPSLPGHTLEAIAEIGTKVGSTVAMTPRLSAQSKLVSTYIDIDGVVISSPHLGGVRRPYEIAKRMFDLIAATLLLALSAPFWVLITLLIRIDSPGPAIFTQERIGRHGLPFRIFKFRTMYMDTPRYGTHPAAQIDPRITRVGRWLRRTSFDELPQLLNVLRGEMSMVGPRPEMPFIVEQYDDYSWQRLQVVPGITGTWQLSADRALPIHENLNYDLYYIRNRNFFMDVAIVLHTAIFAMKGI